MRRLLAVGVGVGFLILFVVGVRGCLEARSDRGLRNYSQDIGTIMAESEQRGKDFFEAIEDSTEIELQNRVSSLRGASESLLDRAENLGVPDQMRDAQSATTLALRLRRDGLGSISSNVTEAAADAETADAIESITNAMGAFYASDILWDQVARPEIEEVLQEEGVEGGLELDSENFGNFMPENSGTQFLDQTEIAELFSGVTGADTSGGLSGLGLVQTSVGGTTLDPTTTATVPDDCQRGRGRGPEPGRFRGEQHRRRRDGGRDRALDHDREPRPRRDRHGQGHDQPPPPAGLGGDDRGAGRAGRRRGGQQQQRVQLHRHVRVAVVAAVRTPLGS